MKTRAAGALLVIQSDAPARPAPPRSRSPMQRARSTARPSASAPDDANEGEMFVEARLGVLPGAGRSRRVDAGGRRHPSTLAAGTARRDPGDFRGPAGRDPGRRARQGRQHAPDHRLRRDRRSSEGTRRARVHRDHGTGHLARRHDHRRTRRRPPQEGALLPTQLGPQVTELTKAGQAAPRPGQHRQPGRGHPGPAGSLELRSSLAEFVLEVDPDDLIE